MISNLKTSSMSPRAAQAALYRVAIVGAGSLKGKEVAEVLEQRNFPSSEVKLLDDDEALGQLEAVKDEITFIQRVRAEQFEHLDVTFFASDANCTRNNWKLAQNLGSAIVDLSYALEDQAGAQVRAPWVERELGRSFAPQLEPGPSVVAHPLALILALLLVRVNARLRVERAVACVFEPASEQGQKGMDELHEQTVNLLSFHELPKNIFDVQVAFNMVSRYGEKSAASLDAISDRILKHYRKISAGQAPVPSLLVLEVPIFHGYALALNLCFERKFGLDELSAALAGEHIRLVGAQEESPSNVNAAGQGDILLSVMADTTDASSAWLWATADNLRLAAATAVELAEIAATSLPKGKIQ